MSIARTVSTAISTFGMLVAFTGPLTAQTSTPAQKGPFEIRFTSGELVATGNQRNFIKDGQLSGVQMSWSLNPMLAVTGAFAWARSRDLTSIDKQKLDVFTTDIGVEARPARWFTGHMVTFSPIVGLGAGVRSYNYRSLDVDAKHNLAGYGSVGGEFGILNRVGVRLEARDYASGYKPLIGTGKSVTRNDVVIMAALRINLH